jgi:urease gamma subunit
MAVDAAEKCGHLGQRRSERGVDADGVDRVVLVDQAVAEACRAGNGARQVDGKNAEAPISRNEVK